MSVLPAEADDPDRRHEDRRAKRQSRVVTTSIMPSRPLFSHRPYWAHRFGLANAVLETMTFGKLPWTLANHADDKALKHLDMALKLDSHHTPTLLNLTKAFFMLGKKQEGINLCKILQNDPTAAVASTAKALLLAYS